jgi:hypothetical protein
LGGRSVVATVQANIGLGDAGWVQVQNGLRATGDEQLLTVRLDGFAGGRELRANARVRRVAVPVDVERYQFGVPQLVVEWWATDPRFYDSTLTSVVAAVSAPSGSGLTFDAEFDLEFGGALPSGVVQVTNDGNFGAPWVAEFAGPLVNPRFENVSTGETLRFVGSVGEGDVLRVESVTRSVTLNGVSRYQFLLPGSRWFDLAPGFSEVRFAASSGVGSGTLSFRSAWI